MEGTHKLQKYELLYIIYFITCEDMYKHTDFHRQKTVCFDHIQYDHANKRSYFLLQFQCLKQSSFDARAYFAGKGQFINFILINQY